MDSTLKTALIAASAALIGALIGFIGSYLLANKNLRKEISLKIAEYRLDWINNLGDQFAIFLSCATRLGFDEKPNEDKEAGSIRQEMIRSATRIQLLMNRDDPDYTALHQNMRNIDSIVRKVRTGKIKLNDAIGPMTEADQEFVRITNDILKREWRRTKRHLRDDTVEVSALKSDLKKSYFFPSQK